HTLIVVAHAPKAPAAGSVATPRTAHTRRGCSRTESASRRHGGNASPHPDRHTLAVVAHAPNRRSHCRHHCPLGILSRGALVPPRMLPGDRTPMTPVVLV
ncbi:hypothetical protein, partial [Halomonas sp. A3H3]|uniref:hypothetical protein n=1 Tax=Halomonas sp. A3H3 TaxID=1346287 RepID=UPI001EE20112